MVARAVSVMVCAIFVGVAMRAIFGEEEQVVGVSPVMVVEDEGRTDRQQVAFFVMLVLVMATSTGFLDSLLNWIPLQAALIPAVGPDRAGPLARVVWKLGLIAVEIGVLVVMLRRWFQRAEIEIWLKKSWSLFERIFPKVLLGIFISGVLAALFPLVRFMSWFDTNTPQSNLMVAFIGAMMYFGTIVGVNIVATMHRFGMHLGPALTLLLAGPAVSLPEVLALVPLVGARKAVTYLALVICSAATCGYLFGMMN